MDETYDKLVDSGAVMIAIADEVAKDHNDTEEVNAEDVS